MIRRSGACGLTSSSGCSWGRWHSFFSSLLPEKRMCLLYWQAGLCGSSGERSARPVAGRYRSGPVRARIVKQVRVFPCGSQLTCSLYSHPGGLRAIRKRQLTPSNPGLGPEPDGAVASQPPSVRCLDVRHCPTGVAFAFHKPCACPGS